MKPRKEAIRDACINGYYDGKTKGKDLPLDARYHQHNPLWHYWWKAVCCAVDTRSWGAQETYEYCAGERR